MELSRRQLLFYGGFAFTLFLPQILFLFFPDMGFLERLIGFPGWHGYIVVVAVFALFLRGMLIRAGWLDSENENYD